MPQVLRSLPPTWETQAEFQALCLGPVPVFECIWGVNKQLEELSPTP